MPRYFEPITEEDLDKKIKHLIFTNCWDYKGEDVVEDDPETQKELWNYISDITNDSTIEKDLKKVDFDWENYYTPEYPHYNADSPEIVGFHTLDNGLTFLGMWAGGDWEWPVFFILYWDGTHVRAYIPKDGNTYNRRNKKAYGNDEEWDAEELLKVYGDAEHCPKFESDKILVDIKDRIVPR